MNLAHQRFYGPAPHEVQDGSIAPVQPVLEVRNVTKMFGPVAALKGMNLTIYPGRVHTVLGENGAGKSTLMKILAGLYEPSSGTILFHGKPYRPKNPREAKALGLSIVFQELSLCRNLTVAQNIYATHEPHRFGVINSKALNNQAHELIQALGLPISATDRVADLSIARRQLVEIAKGLSRPADVLILDEPTSSLSDSEAEILFAIIRRLTAKGTAVIYISHRMEELMQLSDEITVIRDGDYVTTVQKEDTDINQLIALMVGRTLSEVYPPSAHGPLREDLPAVMSVNGLTSKDLFRDVSFELRPGEILGFFGLIGSGRTDVMKALFGLAPTSGSIEINGAPVTIRSPQEAIEHGIAFVTENRKEEGLSLNHSVAHNVSMVALSQFAGPLGFIRRHDERAAVLEEILRFNIKTHSLNTVAGTLSGGNQQKIVLAKWLRNAPRILILDEPTRGVDVGAKFEIYRIIRELTALGTAIILVSSELPEVLGLSDRVLIMHNKHVAALLDRTGLTPEHVMTHAAGFKP
ncbi:sugar ABC transporter ATP-binding protein [Pseudomonas moraviensis subsp. stanleyae]|uniref:sugar ABC transporter ATP-binding protein n=1 Tax=Pseudomonas moraviensis TaxID=321662 RepID=UPI002E3785C4|nr:sugar ABC transporter ATP-binding protein [Pseudomonas moraviensis]MED7666686.1 sugar ABC transporter ATP-binding protein [Pseudomonas moraviensis subsp. stanleyae]